MTLEDFFTLTEMKDGLVVPARVEELVAVMNKEKGCIVKNVSDAIRQWSTVAKVIAATENKGCIDHFIRLDGLLFIDRWLKDAQKFSEDSSDSLVEELVLALLHTLDKLGICNEQLISSGVCLTVKGLLVHTSPNIQDKAKAFLGNLKATSMSNSVKLGSEEAQAVSDVISEPRNRLHAETVSSISSSAISPDQKAPSGSCIKQQPEGVETVVKEPEKLATHFSECDLKEDDKADYFVIQEACSTKRNSTNDTPDTEQGIGLRSKIPGSRSVLEVTNSETRTRNPPNESNPVSIMPKPVGESLDLSENNGGNDDRVDSMSTDLATSLTSISADDRTVLVNCTVTLAQKIPNRGDVNSANTSQDSPVDRTTLRKSQDLDKFVGRVKYDPRQLRSSRVFDSSRSYNRVNVTSKTSTMDLEYGMVDGLQVACLVAKEVERQVTEDCDEQFGSFSKKSPVNGKNDQHADDSSSSESVAEKLSVECSSGEDEKPSKSLDSVDAEQENDTGVVESSQISETAPEADKGASEFDLNIEICSEAAEDGGNSVPNTVSNPVAIVSASKAVAVSGLPAAPLKFEGALGWKGSASTSAFRPACPRRSDGSKQGQGFVFDLNFTEDESLPEPRSRSEKLGFDLNLMSEDRDFDLNDNPLNFSETSDLLPCVGASSSSHQVNSYGGSSNDSVISIMGAKVKHSTFPHQQPPYPFFNGGSRASEAVVGPGRPLVPSLIYGYNGITVAPTMSFSPPMYGPAGGSAAYMVDPRVMMGAPPPAFHTSFAHHQPSYTTNMVGPLLGSNGFRPHLDFNPGFVIDGATRQLFSGQGRSAEVQLQPLFLGIGGKRKEPEGGWDFHQPPPPHL